MAGGKPGWKDTGRVHRWARCAWAATSRQGLAEPFILYTLQRAWPYPWETYSAEHALLDKKKHLPKMCEIITKNSKNWEPPSHDGMSVDFVVLAQSVWHKSLLLKIERSVFLGFPAPVNCTKGGGELTTKSQVRKAFARQGAVTQEGCTFLLVGAIYTIFLGRVCLKTEGANPWRSAHPNQITMQFWELLGGEVYGVRL